jgi:hypothetical protein
MLRLAPVHDVRDAERQPDTDVGDDPSEDDASEKLRVHPLAPKLACLIASWRGYAGAREAAFSFDSVPVERFIAFSLAFRRL